MKQRPNQTQVKHNVREAIREIERGNFISIDKAFEEAKKAYRKQSCK